jgi:hypothetical protein
MDIGGIGEIQSFQFSANASDLRKSDPVTEEKAEKVDSDKPITESTRASRAEKLADESSNSSEKVELEKQQTPSTEEPNIARGEDGFGQEGVDILA